MYRVSSTSAPPVARPAAPAIQPPVGAMSSITGVRPSQSYHWAAGGYGLIGSPLHFLYDYGRTNPYQHSLSAQQYPVNPSTHCGPLGGYELRGLQLVALGNEPINTVRNATGALFLALVNAKIAGPREQALIKRIVVPAGGSAIYAAMARSIYFPGDILLGEPNQAMAIALEQCLRHPDRVVEEIAAIFEQIAVISAEQNIKLDHNLCRIGGSETQIRNARARVKAYLEYPPIDWSTVFPAPSPTVPLQAEASATARARAAAFIWLTLEAQTDYADRLPKEPQFAGKEQLICPSPGAFARIFSGGGQTPSVLRRKMNIEAVGQAFRRIQSLLLGNLDRMDAPARKTDVVCSGDSMELLLAAQQGDLVVLDDRFHRYAIRGAPHYLRSFAQIIRKPWERGARILFVASNASPDVRETLSRQGLHTHWQPAGYNPRPAPPGDTSSATDQFGYVLAMNFAPTARDYDLLPLRA